MKKVIILTIVFCFSLMLQAQASKTLICTAGNLSTLLTASELSTITDLTLTGTIDARDIATMSSMSLLAVIDLSGAVIVGYGANPANSLPDNAFNFKYSLTSIKIPSSVTSIGINAFFLCMNLTSVNIPPAVTSIKEGTFLLCAFTSITIPPSVTSIGNSAFGGCYKLTSITIPPSVTSIGSDAFGNCSGLTSVTIPSSVTSIGNHTFGDCTGLTSVTMPSSITSIGTQAFVNCTGLTSIVIPSSVTSIASNAFNGCAAPFNVDAGNLNYSSEDGVLFNKNRTSLLQFPNFKTGSYTIPSSVTSIGDQAFWGCKNTTSVTIPSSVTSISQNAFSGYGGSFLVDAGNPNYSSLDGVLFNKTQTQLIQYPVSKAGSYIIPSSVTAISNMAFSGCKYLTSVIAPSSLTSIGSKVFENCTGLTSITIPSSVTSLGDYAFNNCTSLISLSLPTSVTSIGNYAFNNCTGLTSINIPLGLTAIMDGVFNNCQSLTSVNIPSSVTSIGFMAFYNCSGLTSLTIPPSISSIGGKAFFNCSGVKALDLPLNITSIPYGTFSGCTGLSSIVIPSSVVTISDNAFFGCTGLTSVSIPPSVNILGFYAFSGCTNLASISIPSSVTNIGNGTFDGCKGPFTVEEGNPNYCSQNGVLFNKAQTTLIQCPTSITETYTIPSTVTAILAGAFDRCTGLTSVIIPSSVTSIGDYAFQGCSGLTSVSIPSSVTSIGNSTFNGCSSLTSLTIPSSVSSIGSMAFANCIGLTSVSIPSSVISIGSQAFINSNVLITVDPENPNYSSLDGVLFNKPKTLLIQCPSSKTGNYLIPSTVTAVGEVAFGYCAGLTSISIPSSVSSIGNFAFVRCSGQLNVDSNNPNFSSEDGVLFSKNKTILIQCPTSKTGTYSIPSSVTSVGASAFDHCVSLTSLNIPSPVTTIGANAFDACSGLISVDPANLNFSSADGVLFNKDKTSLIQCPVSKTGAYTIPSSVTAIGPFAFDKCSGLTSIIIPPFVSSIGRNAFAECSGLTSIYVFAPIPVNFALMFGNIPFVFELVNKSSCKLYVLCGSKVLYANADQWKNFVNISELPGDPETMTGLTSICKGQNSVDYAIPPIPNATSYIWTLPAGTTGTSSTNNITVNFGPSAISGTISVKGHNDCGDGVVSTLAIIVNQLPLSPGIVTGTNLICNGQNSVNYTVPLISNATSYIWTLPAGATGESNTNSITVDFSTSAISGDISVKGHNDCGDGAISALAITVNSLPASAGTITGNTSICTGQNSVVYNVPAVTNATSYIWSLPAGATGESATNTISINYGTMAVSGNISVKGHNDCGDGASSNLAITVNPFPANAGTIIGTTTVCPGQNSVNYTIPAITNATSYVWTLPTGATGTSVTNTISLNFGSSAVSGDITVKGHNDCGDGAESNLAITVNQLTGSAGAITGGTAICQGQNSVSYTVPVISNASSYIWTLPTGTTGTSLTNSIFLDFGASAVSGNITVKGHNDCGDGDPSSLSVTVNPKPVKPVATQNGNILHSDAPNGNQWYNNNLSISGATNQDYTFTTIGDYTVVVTLNGCSSDTSSTSVITGFDPLDFSKKISVYPNPVSDDLTIEYSGNFEEIKFKIVNQAGQIIYDGKLSDKIIVHTSSFGSGLYIIKFDVGKSYEFRKLIKNKN